MTGASTRYSVPEEVLAAHLEGEAVLLHMETKAYFRLNETAAAIFRQVERGADEEAIAADLCSRYEIDAEAALREVRALLAELASRGLLEVRPDDAAS